MKKIASAGQMAALARNIDLLTVAYLAVRCEEQVGILHLFVEGHPRAQSPRERRPQYRYRRAAAPATPNRAVQPATFRACWRLYSSSASPIMTFVFQ